MINLVFIGPFPPPHGGISVLNNDIYNYFFDNSSFQIIGKINVSKDKNILTLLNQISLTLTSKPNVYFIQVNGSISYLRELSLIYYLKLKKQKVVIHLHASIKRKKRNFPFNNNKWANRLLINNLVGKVDACIFISVHILNEFKGLLKDSNIKKSYSIENFINVNAFKSTENNENKMNILFLGRLSIDKGINEIINILPFFLKYHPNVMFYLAGSINKSQLTFKENEVLEYHLNKNLIIYPPIFNEEKINFFSKGDIFIYPSHHEVFPVTLLEAMAASLPIITTKVGINESIFTDNENCLYINIKDSEDLKNKLLTLISDGQLRVSMAQRNKEKAMKYDIDLAMNKIENIFYDVCKP